MMKGAYVEPESFLLVQLLAYLFKACENKIQQDVRIILKRIRSFFVKNEVFLVSPRVLKFLLSSSEDLNNVGVQLIK
jgi:hypothetical protein